MRLPLSPSLHLRGVDRPELAHLSEHPAMPNWWNAWTLKRGWCGFLRLDGRTYTAMPDGAEPKRFVERDAAEHYLAEASR